MYNSDSTVTLVLPISTVLSGITPRLQSCVNNSWALHYQSSATTHMTVE